MIPVPVIVVLRVALPWSQSRADICKMMTVPHFQTFCQVSCVTLSAYIDKLEWTHNQLAAIHRCLNCLPCCVEKKIQDRGALLATGNSDDNSL